MLKRLLLTLCLLLLAVIALADSFMVSDVQVEGNNRIEGSAILAAISIKPGDMITPEDVDQAMHSIFAMGRFDDVRAELTEVQGAKILTFVVKELPLVRDIRFSGNEELKTEKLQPLVSLRIPELIDYGKIRNSVQEILKAYAEDGYRAAKVDPQVEIDKDNQATLTFKIDEGAKVLIDDIHFSGNRVLSESELQDVMETQERWWLSWLTGRGAYQEEVMQLDLERIKAAYQEHGYMDVQVVQPKLTLIKDNRYLDVLIEIDEGPQYRVGTVDVRGDLLRTKPELLLLVQLKTGEIFNRSLLREDVIRVTDLYADEGYANVNVAPLTNKDSAKRTIDLTLDIEQGQKVYVERIKIRGNTKTRDKVIRRELPIVEGESYSATKIKQGNRNIRNLGFFDEVNVASSPGSDPGRTVLNVDVTERPTGTFSLGVGYSSVDQFITQGSISQDNFLGYGWRLRLSGALSGTSTTYSLGLTDPHFLDTDWTLGGEVYKTEREYTEYDENRTGGAIRGGHPISKYTKAYLTYRYEEQEILNISDAASVIIKDQEGKNTLSSVMLEFARNSTDYYQDPSTGGISHLTLEYAGLGGTSNFARFRADHRHFFPLFWGTVFSAHGEIGYVMRTSSNDIPLGERFFLGGIRTLRGFENREVGPKVGNDFIGGEKMAYFNLEYLFPIQREMGLKGVLFYDTGNAWLEQDDYFSDMRSSVGAGIRWLSPLGPLRFEWGYNLDPRDDEKASVFEFSIGTAF